MNIHVPQIVYTENAISAIVVDDKPAVVKPAKGEDDLNIDDI